MCVPLAQFVTLFIGTNIPRFHKPTKNPHYHSVSPILVFNRGTLWESLGSAFHGPAGLRAHRLQLRTLLKTRQPKSRCRKLAVLYVYHPGCPECTVRFPFVKPTFVMQKSQSNSLGIYSGFASVFFTLISQTPSLCAPSSCTTGTLSS